MRLDFPFVPIGDTTPLSGLDAALGMSEGEITYLGRTTHHDPLEWNALVLVDAAALRGLHPHVDRLRGLPVDGVIVSAAGDVDGVDFLSRYFAPAAGIDEDPVTGSAHCTLIDHWGRRLGRDQAHALQASPRGGELDVARRRERVFLTGTAVTVIDGELKV